MGFFKAVKRAILGKEKNDKIDSAKELDQLINGVKKARSDIKMRMKKAKKAHFFELEHSAYRNAFDALFDFLVADPLRHYELFMAKQSSLKNAFMIDIGDAGMEYDMLHARLTTIAPNYTHFSEQYKAWPAQSLSLCLPNAPSCSCTPDMTCLRAPIRSVLVTAPTPRSVPPPPPLSARKQPTNSFFFPTPSSSLFPTAAAPPTLSIDSEGSSSTYTTPRTADLAAQATPTPRRQPPPFTPAMKAKFGISSPRAAPTPRNNISLCSPKAHTALFALPKPTVASPTAASAASAAIRSPHVRGNTSRHASPKLVFQSPQAKRSPLTALSASLASPATSTSADSRRPASQRISASIAALASVTQAAALFNAHSPCAGKAGMSSPRMTAADAVKLFNSPRPATTTATPAAVSCASPKMLPTPLLFASPSRPSMARQQSCLSPSLAPRHSAPMHSPARMAFSPRLQSNGAMSCDIPSYSLGNDENTTSTVSTSSKAGYSTDGMSIGGFAFPKPTATPSKFGGFSYFNGQTPGKAQNSGFGKELSANAAKESDGAFSPCRLFGSPVRIN